VQSLFYRRSELDVIEQELCKSRSHQASFRAQTIDAKQIRMLSMGTDQRMAIVTCGSHGGSLLNDLDRWCWGMKKGLPSPKQILSS
jgi:hypothetical protein